MLLNNYINNLQPEGEEQTKTKISFIKPDPSTPYITNFTTELPPSDIYVPDSAIFQVTSIGQTVWFSEKYIN